MRFLSGIESKNKGLIMEINPCRKKIKALLQGIGRILIKKKALLTKRANKALDTQIGYPI